MLTSIDIHSNVAVYNQIENHIQFAIAAGELNPGDQLPSVRELSERLKVNPNTVAKAYRDLEVMGLLFTRRGMGVFVQKGIERKCREDVRRKIVARFHEVVSEARVSGMPKKDVHTVVDKSMTFDTSPYGDTPKGVLALAKKSRSK